jgi:hypothetical protein
MAAQGCVEILGKYVRKMVSRNIGELNVAFASIFSDLGKNIRSCIK